MFFYLLIVAKKCYANKYTMIGTLLIKFLYRYVNYLQPIPTRKYIYFNYVLSFDLVL